MTALYDQWQAARQLRQSEAVNRRDRVSADLERWQSDRLAHAVQLRQNLDQLVIDLRTNTAQWLAQTAADRAVQIMPRQQARQVYIQQLQAETEVLLASYQGDRTVKAAEVRQRLEADCQVLQATVSELRLDIAQALRQIQQQVAAIQAQTVVELAGYRQDQAMVRAELLPQLTDYVEALQVQVQATLKDLTVVRQQAAVENQEKRQSDRAALSESVNAMFDELVDFRHQLQAQRAQLSQIVWGGAPVTAPAAHPVPTKPAATKPTVTKPAATKPAVTKPAATKSAAIKPAATSVPARAVAKPAPQATPKSVAPAPVPVPAVAPAPAPAPAATAVTPVAPPAEPPSLEEVVYNYLHLSQGARLSDIETELGINRFQAVDALRSLIQKDLIVKQDRTYLVQEEAVL